MEARGRRRWRSLRERLGFKGTGCCGGLWAGHRASLEEYHGGMSDDDEPAPAPQRAADTHVEGAPEAACFEAGEEMNLAAALAAERQFRAASGEGAGTAARVSLMRLLEEGEAEGEDRGWWCCCVCMARRKGAALIPCGHAFCRACARELWLTRGACALCNRPILEILDIF